MRTVRTTCPYCGVGCGIRARVTGARNVEIAGDPDHPANAGRLCSKGTHLGETVGLEGRLLEPMIGEEAVSWDRALDEVAGRLRKTIAEHGPDAVGFYVSGQLLTEDYYAVNKLAKGFVGTGNIDTNSRLCMASAVAAHTRAFGEDVVPCSYDDLDCADLVLLIGSNTAWCHPVIWQRIERARERRGSKIVVIDPRRTETAERATCTSQSPPTATSPFSMPCWQRCAGAASSTKPSCASGARFRTGSGTSSLAIPASPQRSSALSPTSSPRGRAC
jgi:assimilatory nitrate reductase catalytic subunit